MELGILNLFEYAQEYEIKEVEYLLIFQQIFNQIILLHQHNIAHRDIKPQNIIFVKNKGWLLCDFGEALKDLWIYTSYNLLGIQDWDVLIQQDLLHNDLYALGITLLIIKHQIKKSSDIEDYLEKQDEIIQKLLQKTQLQHFNQFQIDTNQQIIEPNVNKQKLIDSQQLGDKEIIEYLKFLKIIDIESPPQFLQKLIKTVDDYLEKKKLDQLVYINICQHVFKCPVYIKSFKNLPRFKILRQVKFWRQKQKMINLAGQEQLILFMHQLGFIDLVLQFGFQYLTQKYSFSVHIIIIKILLMLQEKDRAFNEYNTLLKFRDQYFMNDYELKLLIQISVPLLDFRFINESDLKYLANSDLEAIRLDLNKQQIDYDKSEEDIVKQIMYQYNIERQFASEYNFDQINTQIFREEIMNAFSLQLSDKLNDEILKIHKFFTTAFLFQLSLSQSIQSKILLERQQFIRSIKKQMNFLLIH